jgi:predicted nucleotidyltransferase/DNA-binding HxlR family transcriptional regulator
MHASFMLSEEEKRGESVIYFDTVVHSMIQLYQKITQLNVLEHFFLHPSEAFYLRELARLLDMSPMTVKRTLELLVTDNVIIKTASKGRILYTANMESHFFRYSKIAYNLARLEEAGIVKSLIESIPGISSAVLYGSHARGDNDEHSDIDILVISVTGRASRERIPGVNVMAMTAAKWSEVARTNRAFYLDVITEGIVLHGTRPVVE